MTPKELMAEQGYLSAFNLSFSARAEHQSILTRYMYKDCVVAYSKSELGVMFIIKGKIKYFTFLIISDHIYVHYKIQRLNYGYFSNPNHWKHLTILNQEMYQNYFGTCFMDNL